MPGRADELAARIEELVRDAGERQRLGIARALYHDPDVLVLDEVTSALDVETERDVMRTIRGFQGTKTLVLITHRLATIEQCDIVYELKDGRLP